MAAMAAREIAVGETEIYAAIEAECVPAAPAADAALLSRLKSGERAAFEELVATYQPVIFDLAYRLLGDPEEARDVAQETFLKVYRHVSGFRGESGLKTWLYRIAVNQVSNHRRWWRRRHRRETVSLDAAPGEQGSSLGERLPCHSASPEQVALGREREQRVMVALDAVKHDCRVAVVLRDVQELSYEEIAEALEISVGTVKSRIARGREELRRRLRDMGV
jgi:RNA polymerase sigma-70 factor (ECF subfamily)